MAQLWEEQRGLWGQRRPRSEGRWPGEWREFLPGLPFIAEGRREGGREGGREEGGVCMEEIKDGEGERKRKGAE